MYLHISKEAFFFYDVNQVLYWMNKNPNDFIKYKDGNIKNWHFCEHSNENDIRDCVKRTKIK